MEDCLHTSSENLSKLVSWAHSHGTICSLIPNLKHLLTEGAHGNLTAMWGCGAGHAYHWPLAVTCRSGSQDRVCFQDSRSFNSDSPSIIAMSSEMQQRPAEKYLNRSSTEKAECSRNRDSCDFSYSEHSEVDEIVEEYDDEGDLFHMACESSVTDEDSDYDSRLQNNSLKRREAGPSLLPDSPSHLANENSNEVIVKKIKQEGPEDYYIVTNAEITVDNDGTLRSGSKSGPASYLGPSKPSALLPASHGPEKTDSQGVSVVPPASSRTAGTKSGRSCAASQKKSNGGQGAGQKLVLQMPVSTSGGNQQINIPLSALQLPGQEEQNASEDTGAQTVKTGASSEVSLSPSISAEPEVSSSQQQSSVSQSLAKDASAQSSATELQKPRNPRGRQRRRPTKMKTAFGFAWILAGSLQLHADATPLTPTTQTVNDTHPCNTRNPEITSRATASNTPTWCDKFITWYSLSYVVEALLVLAILCSVVQTFRVRKWRNRAYRSRTPVYRFRSPIFGFHQTPEPIGTDQGASILFNVFYGLKRCKPLCLTARPEKFVCSYFVQFKM
ncbi:uncharacterized protein KIAA1958 isoform X4 [Scyliorhinus torazame]|uniref:uncharacterized protein KIAA1958 isoform X4 n=1 Tax=Scyliorhinus torazame TaxID=75743 RepID=UPI003B5AF4CB